MALTEEQKERARENLALAREAKKAKVATVEKQQQCVMCGVRFDADLIESHLMQAHGQTLSAPAAPQGSRPGTIFKPNPKAPAAKVPYTKEWAKANLEWEENYVPPVSQSVTWNRLSFRFEAGVPCRAPKIHIAILNEWLQNISRPQVPEEATRYGVYKGGVGPLPEV